MAKIEGFRVKNYRALRDLTLGKLWNTQSADSLSAMTAVIGPNGVGKSTLLDAFGFLADCLRFGVEEACDRSGRGGFERLRTQGVDAPIEFEVYYKENAQTRPITYELTIDLDEGGRPTVVYERLRQRRKGQKHGRPFSFLILNHGKGVAWKGEAEGTRVDAERGQLDMQQFLASLRAKADTQDESALTEFVELDDLRKLGIATLGSLKQHPRISAFRRFIEGWYLSYFTPDAARSLPLAGPQKHLNVHGDNLGNVVQFMEREHRAGFQKVLNRIANKIPGIDRIDCEKSQDGRLLLKFNDKAFKDPFYAQQMSDGTLKIFAYLLLLEDPTPPPFICIEEPENGLYHKLLAALVSEFRNHTTGGAVRSQIFITTHQPYFVDTLSPEETWILEKGVDGFSTIRRASEIPVVRDMVSAGLPLGGLWYSDYLDAR